jgi:hypothetical protein
MKSFIEELELLLNKHCKDNQANTPDFILAKYLDLCLQNFTIAANWKRNWFQDPPGETFCEKEALNKFANWEYKNGEHCSYLTPEGKVTKYMKEKNEHSS